MMKWPFWKVAMSYIHTNSSPYFVRIIIFIASCFMTLAHASSVQVGDRVEAEWKKGLWYSAKIIEVNAEQYKVRYESDGVIQSVTPERIRPIVGNGPAPGSNQSPANVQTPVIANGFPTIAGTAWKIDWGIRGGNVQVFLFCKSGRWEVVSPTRSSGSVSLMGTYDLNRNSLVTRNLNGGEVTNYRMTWKEKVLELDSGKSVMRLHYNGISACK